jgi:hypothetical protein
MEGIDLEPRFRLEDFLRLTALVITLVAILLFIFLSANKAFAGDYVCSPTGGFYRDMEFKRKEFNSQSEANRFSFEHMGIVVGESGKYAVIYHDSIPAPETSYVCVVVYE